MQAQAQDSRSAARLTALYESHATDVFRYALHLTGRREDAEDVVQFVFLQAFATLEAGTELVYPRAWLIKAAKRRSLSRCSMAAIRPSGPAPSYARCRLPRSASMARSDRLNT